MSSLQKRLKLLSFGLMGFGLLDVIAGVFMLVASPLAAGLTFDVAGEATDGVIAAEVLGIVGLLVGAYCLVVGVMGARAANNPRHVSAFKRLDLLLVVACVIEFGLGLASGQASWVELVLAVLGTCAFAYAGKAHDEVVDR